jgi:hypothetical protein
MRESISHLLRRPRPEFDRFRGLSFGWTVAEAVFEAIDDSPEALDLSRDRRFIPGTGWETPVILQRKEFICSGTEVGAGSTGHAIAVWRRGSTGQGSLIRHRTIRRNSSDSTA